MNHMIAILRMSYAALQENVLEESTRMIPDTRQRLEGALQDLSNFMVSSRSPQHDAQHNPPTKHPIFHVVHLWCSPGMVQLLSAGLLKERQLPRVRRACV